MNKVLNNILETIGNTPIIKLNRAADDCTANILAKVEFINPGSSAKSRTALGMLLAAEKSGIINPETVIAEPTSGNQGISLAMAGAVRGYRTIIIMPENMSIERRKLIKAYGAEVVVTPADQDVSGAVKKAKEIAQSTPNSWMPNQFENPANPEYHRNTTAQEIIEQCNFPIDALVAGVGTGGTMSGVASVLKEQYPQIKVYAVEPTGSAVISGNPPGAHKIQGIGDGFIPENLNLKLLDGTILVKDDDAINTANRKKRSHFFS